MGRLGQAAGFAGARRGAPSGTDLDPRRRQAGRGRVSRRAEGAEARRGVCLAASALLILFNQEIKQ